MISGLGIVCSSAIVYWNEAVSPTELILALLTRTAIQFNE